MQAVNILTVLCYMGNTEPMGVFTTDESPKDEMVSMFGNETSNVVVDGEVKLFTNYLYSYGDRLSDPKRGEIGADAVVTVYNEKDSDRIYLYEIE